jgi:hypothetical protein
MRYIFILIFLASCFTERKAENQIDKAQYKFPEVVAKKSAQYYPCGKQLLRIDTCEIIEYRETIDSIDRIVERLRIDTFKDCKSVRLKLVKSNQVIKQLREIIKNRPPIVRTILVEDTAKLKFLYSEINKEKSKKEEYQVKYESMSKYTLWFAIALIISLLIHFFK